MSQPLKLDYSLKTMEERNELISKIIDQTPPDQLSNKYLEILADYVMDAIPKKEKLAHTYLTDNRLVTINKRETSYEGLVEKFENGEDGIYNFITEDKNIIMSPKLEITEADVAAVPGLRELRAAIEEIEEEAKRATGRRKYLLKKQAIEMRRDQYILKSAYYQPSASTPSKSLPYPISLEGRKWIDDAGEPQSSELVSLFYPDHVSAIMRNYKSLKIATAGKLHNDFYYLLQEFDAAAAASLRPYPQYEEVLKLKIRGKQNAAIQNALQTKFNKTYSIQYISDLWRNKIPKIIANYAKKQYLEYHYLEIEKGTWKTCTKCKQTKLAHPYYFTHNNASKDNFYSICKECRNKKD